MIERTLRIYPYTPGGVGTSIDTALEGKVRLRPSPPVPETKFVDASNKSFNTIPPNDFSFFEMINENVQQEPAGSYDVELAGQLAAIGIVKGKPFQPDARMRKILTDAAAVGNAAGRVLNWRYARAIPTGPTTRALHGTACSGRAGPTSRRHRPCSRMAFEPLPPTGARTLDSRTAFYYGYTLDSPGMIMRIPEVGSQYLMGFLDAEGTLSMAPGLTR